MKQFSAIYMVCLLCLSLGLGLCLASAEESHNLTQNSSQSLAVVSMSNNSSVNSTQLDQVAEAPSDAASGQRSEAAVKTNETAVKTNETAANTSMEADPATGTASGLSINGTIFNDQNCDGVRNGNETGLSGWAVHLMHNGADMLNALTDVAGNYLFTGLEQGRYIVAEDHELGWNQTAPEGGAYDLTLADKDADHIDFGNSKSCLNSTPTATANETAIIKTNETAAVIANETAVIANETAVIANETAVIANETAVIANETDIKANETIAVKINETATNKTNETAAVAANETAVTINETAINTNETAAVTANETAAAAIITANETVIKTNETAAVTANETAAVTANETAAVTANETAAVAANETAAVTINETAINTNETAAVTANETAINTNETAAVTANETAAVTINETAINTNETAAVTANETVIKTNETAAVTANETAINTNETAAVIANETAAVASNETAVKTNETAAIKTNETAVVKTNETSQEASSNSGTDTSKFQESVSATGSLSINGTIFNDLNCDGVRNGNETGLPGWAVHLMHNGADIIPNAHTDTAGNYLFAGLEQGRYIVAEDHELGWNQTAPEGGAYDLTLADKEADHIDFGNSKSCLATPANAPADEASKADGNVSSTEVQTAPGELVPAQSNATLPANGFNNTQTALPSIQPPATNLNSSSLNATASLNK